LDKQLFRPDFSFIGEWCQQFVQQMTTQYAPCLTAKVSRFPSKKQESFGDDDQSNFYHAPVCRYRRCLLTNGKDRISRERAAKIFKLDLADMEERHHLITRAWIRTWALRPRLLWRNGCPSFPALFIYAHDSLSKGYRSMRHTLRLLIVLTGTGSAQWRGFSEGRSTIAPSSLAAHNAVRARLGIAPLSWSDRLAARSQDWADILVARNQFSHRPNSTYGENLFELTGATASPEQVVNAWAAESRDYDYSSNSCRGVCGHYTQIIWGRTKEVGCAVARAGVREVWVCNYDPPGNLAGKRPY
jgi:pathogenesis-related protein 1